jgi:hypothetical protein
MLYSRQHGKINHTYSSLLSVQFIDYVGVKKHMKKRYIKCFYRFYYISATQCKIIADKLDIHSAEVTSDI